MRKTILGITAEQVSNPVYGECDGEHDEDGDCNDNLAIGYDKEIRISGKIQSFIALALVDGAIWFTLGVVTYALCK